MKVKVRLILGITEKVEPYDYVRHYNYVDTEVEIPHENFMECNIIGGKWLDKRENPSLLEGGDG